MRQLKQNEVARSRIPSELSDDEVRAVRADSRLQREIAETFGLTASAVSLIKARKCRGDVPAIAPVQMPVPKPVQREIKITVCPTARAGGHKPFGRHIKHRTVPESGKLSITTSHCAPIADLHTTQDSSQANVMCQPQSYQDDWFML